MTDTNPTQSVIEKLDEIEQRYEDLQKQIADPENSGDSNKIVELSRQQSNLKDIVSMYRRYKKTVADAEEANEILEQPDTDAELKQLAQQEAQQLEEEKQSLFGKMMDDLVMADDTSIHSIIIEIRAGTGGEEASLFARDLYNMYAKYAESRKYKIEPITFSSTEIGGFREAVFAVKGRGVWSDFGYEGGGHRVQRVPQTESQGRIHTSAATVAVLAEPEQLDININPDEVVEHVSRSSGPGGQSVNKLSSAVRLEHTPTGITVNMQDEKSQHKNRAKAWRILKGRIYEYYESRERAKRESQRKTMIGTGDRSQKIRTYNFPQNRVTDHRINLSLYRLDKIINGDMSELIEALRQHDKQQRLADL